MLKYTLRLWLVLFICTMMMSCIKSISDQQKPEIILQNAARLDTTTLLSGSNLAIDLAFSDDLELQSYNLAINCQSAQLFSSTWHSNITRNLIGSTAQASMHISIADTALTGQYLMQLFCTDTDYQHSDTLNHILQIQNSSDIQDPQINMVLPTGSPITMFANGNMVLIATIQDNIQLHAYQVQLRKSTNNQNIYQTLPVFLTGNTIDIQEIVPLPTNPGFYELEIKSIDWVNNTKSHIIQIQVI